MTDPLAEDPPACLLPPARTVALTVESGGAQLHGVLYLPAGPGPHPVVLVLQGFPGNERNADLAQALRRAGYASCSVLYRGSWGMPGSWSWGAVLEDAAAAVATLRAPSTVATYELDAARVAVVGHSLGGFVALRTAAADPAIAAVGSVSGFDFGTVAAACAADPALRAAYVEMWAGALGALRGTSSEALVAEMEAGGDAWRLAALGPRLAGRPVLLIGTGRDDVTPAGTHHEPLVAAYRAAGLPRLEHHVFATDHSLSDHRVALARTTIGFLDRHLRPAA